MKNALRSIAILMLVVSCHSEQTTAPENTAPPSNTAAADAPPASDTPVAPASPTITCASAPNRLCPTDEASKDPSFETFRSELAKAVTERNETRLLELVDPKIRTSFGDDGGIETFRASWKDRPLWNELAKILSLGGSFRSGGDSPSFWAPYVYSKWPESIDPFLHVAAIRSGVPVRASPASDAPVVQTVDWAILELIASDSSEWLHVRTSERREGWASATDVHSPVGYRAGFSNRSGAWKMDALVAGD